MHSMLHRPTLLHLKQLSNVAIMSIVVFLTLILLMAYGYLAEEKSENFQESIIVSQTHISTKEIKTLKMEITAMVEEKLRLTIQNQSQTFTKEVQFLRMENTAKDLQIQALEEKSLVHKEVIEKLTSENEALKNQINQTIVFAQEQAYQIKSN